MPEMPELEAFKKYIEIKCLDKVITDITTTDLNVVKMSFDQFKKKLKGTSFEKVERKGKFLIIDISKLDKKMVMHFGLTGFLFYAKKLMW